MAKDGDGKSTERRASFGAWMPLAELRILDDQAHRLGVSRNTLIRLSLRKLPEMKFLDSSELARENDRMELLICELGSLLRQVEEICGQMDERGEEGCAFLLEKLRRDAEQIERIQDRMIESQERAGRAQTLMHEAVMNLLRKSIDG